MDDSDIDVRAIVGLLRRQMRLIMTVVFITLGIAAIAIFALKPIYAATALVLVDPSTKNLLSADAQIGSTANDNARIDSEVEIIKSESTLLRTIRDHDLVTHGEFGVQLGTTEKFLTWLHLSNSSLPSGDEALRAVVTNLEKALNVSRRGQTYLIAVRFSSTSPRVAADLANAIAKSYIAEQLQAKVTAALAIRDKLYARIEETNKAVADSENALDTFLFANIERIATEAGNADISSLNERLNTLERERQSIERLADVIGSDIEQQSWLSVSETLGLDALAELERQRREIAESISNAAEGSQAEIDLKGPLADIERQLAENANAELARLKQSARDHQAEALDLKTQVRTSALSSDLPVGLVTAIYTLQQNAAIARNQYQTLLSRLREVETQVDLQVADSRIVSAALPPGAPTFPNTPLILALAGLTGLGLAIGLAVLSEHYVGGFTSAAQTEAVLKTPVLTAIPKLKPGTLPEDAPAADAICKAPLSNFAESVRQIRAGIDQSMRRRHAADNKQRTPGTVVMVCSAVPGEGKTTLALSLARAYALSGQRTMLIDADMRRPGIHKQLQMEPKIGLYDYLANSADTQTLSSVLSRDEETGLDVLVGARSSGVPTDQLFASKRFATLIDSATKHFDIIILDTPPALPVVDALYLAQYADYLMFVARWANTSQTDVRTALARLRKALPERAELAVALNLQDTRNPGYFSEYEAYGDARA